MDAIIKEFVGENLFLVILLMVVGLIIMIKSADLFVDSAVKIAEISGIPKIIIGATVVSLATTLPELFVSTTAVANGSNAMAIGNALGSIIFNTAIVLSVAAIFMHGKVDRKNVLKKASILLLALLTFIIFARDLVVNRPEGLILFSLIGIYTYINLVSAKKGKDLENRTEVDNVTKAYLFHFSILIISSLLIKVGAEWLVIGAEVIATKASISENVIGLTILAMGTSLPELATTISAIIKKEQSLSVGNILGANVLNVTLILGMAGIIAKDGLTIGKDSLIGFASDVPQTLMIDLPFILIIILLFVVPIFFKSKLFRWQGIAGLSLYSIYLTYLLMNA